MQETAKTLAEILEFADEAKGKGVSGTVYLNEKEAAPDGTVFGDEDTGGKMEQRMRLVLRTTEDSYYYADEFKDMEFYREAVQQLEKLGTYFPVERVSEEEVEQKRLSG